jgi:hypothetical protein
VPKARAASRPWTHAEDRVVDRFARAIASGRYPTAKAAMPDVRRELARMARESRRTDVAVRWRLLCRAYDFGLPRRKHSWTDRELRLLGPYASALARGECPDVTTAARLVKRAFKRAGLGMRHPNREIRERIIACAQALGRASTLVHYRPEENRVIDRFSRMLVRNEYPFGKAAVADCRRAYAQARIVRHRSDEALRIRINARARALGWVSKSAPWSAPAARIIESFARALASGGYPSIAAATRACRHALERAGRFGNRGGAGLYTKLEHRAAELDKPRRSAWSRR